MDGRSLFVAVEGIDHAGKTTLVEALTTALSGRGIRVAARKEPSAGPVGLFFRQLSSATPLTPAAMALLSAADRHDRQIELTRQLHRHDVVLSDRYYLSGLAYHSADGVDPTWYQHLNNGIVRPDLYLVLDLPIEQAIARAESPDGYWERSGVAALLPEAYRDAVDLISSTEDAHVTWLDAAGTRESVLDAALDALSPQGAAA